MLYLFVAIIYIAAAIVDMKTRTIPDELSLLLIGYKLLYCLLHKTSIGSSIVDLLIMFALLFFISVVGDFLLSLKESESSVIGGGDLKLLCATSFTLNLENTLVIFLISQIACLLFAILYTIRGKGSIKAVPLAPFLLLGLFAKILIDWSVPI